VNEYDGATNAGILQCSLHRHPLTRNNLPGDGLAPIHRNNLAGQRTGETPSRQNEKKNRKEMAEFRQAVPPNRSSRLNLSELLAAVGVG